MYISLANKNKYIKRFLGEGTTPEVDSNGNTLTPEQVKFFANSKVRDRKGNLLVCYHGTDSKFTTFEKGDIGFHFGNENTANNRKEFKTNSNTWDVNRYYLDIKNPFVETFDYGAWDGVTIAVVWLFGTSYDGLYDYLSDGTLYETYVPKEFTDSNSMEIIKDVVTRFADVDDWSSTYGYNSEPNKIMRKLLKSKGYDGIIYSNTYESDGDDSIIAFEPNQIKSITNTNPTNSNNINEKLLSERLHKLGSNCFITDSPYDIKNLIMNKPKLYRILYDANIDMYMIGDGNEIIHWDMIRETYRQGYYHTMEEFIEELGGTLDNYVETGMYGLYNDGYDIDPYLLYMVFSPDEQSWVLGDDSYDAEYHSPYGNIFTRDCDLKDIELYKVLKVSNDVKNLYDNKELTEKMSTSIKSGDRVKMDFHMKSNNGATGTCKGRLGELCFIEWDDGSKSKEITSYLTKIEDIKESFSYQMSGMVEDDFYTFERDNITYHFFFTPGRRTENKFAILAVDYGIRFDKEPYKNERGTTTIPFSRIYDVPQQKGYFEFTSETHPELVDAMYEDNKVMYRDLIVNEMAKHMNINESNELEQRTKKHKGKCLTESNEFKQNYYPKLPVSLKEVERDGDNITYLIVDKNTQSLAELTHYSNPRTNVGCIVHKVFNDNCGLWVGYETPYSPKDVLNIVHRFVSNDYFYESKSNELADRAKKHKKKSRGMGWHMSMNAGNVEKGIEVFNNATSCNSGECSSMGEAVEKRTFYYEGPVYLFDSIYKDVVKMCTDATSRKQALSNIRYRVCNELGRKGLKVKDEFLYEMPDDKETSTCDECGHPLNDMGQCPACEQGEEERYDDLTNLEALSELRRMD